VCLELDRDSFNEHVLTPANKCLSRDQFLLASLAPEFGTIGVTFMALIARTQVLDVMGPLVFVEKTFAIQQKKCGNDP
jgi:hypothetical protein